MAEELDFSELNSTMAELRQMLVSLGPALTAFNSATLGGAAGVDRLGEASQEAAKVTREYSGTLKQEKQARKKTNVEIEAEAAELRKKRADTAKDRQLRQDHARAMEPYTKGVKLASDAVQQGQRAQRDLTAVFRGLAGSAIGELALGIQRFAQSKNLINLEKAKMDQYIAEIPLAKEAHARAVEKLNQAKQEEAAQREKIKGLEESRAIAAAEEQSTAHSLAIAIEEREVQKQFIEAKKQQIEQIKSNVAGLQEQLTSLEAEQQAAFDRALAAQELVSELEQLQDGSAEAAEMLAAAREQAAATASAFERASYQVDRTAEKLAKAQGHVDAHTSELDRSTQALGGLEDRVDAATAAHDAATTALTENTSALDSAQGKLEQLEGTTETLSNAEKAAAKKIEDLADAAQDAAANLENMKLERIGSVFSTLSNTGQKLGSWMEKTGFALRDFQRRVGISAGELAKMAITDTGKALNIVKGKWKEMVGARGMDNFDRMIEARDIFGDEFGGTLTGAAASKLAAQARSMGVTIGELAKARRGFMTLSMGDLKGATEMQGKFVAEFKKKGLNTKDAFDAVAKYTDIMARNGGRFAASFAKAAADAKKIGVDLKKVDAFGDSIISDYEGFLEKQSELGAMGFNFDSSKMAQIAESGDTGALMNELRSQLAAQGKDLTKMRRSEQLALSNAFGIPMEELLRLSQPKPAENSREDRIAGSGEKTAMHAERIEKAVLNLPPEMSAIGMAIQQLSSALGIGGPIVLALVKGFSLLKNALGFGGAAKAAKEAAGGVAESAAGSLADKAKEAAQGKLAETGESLVGEAQGALEDKAKGLVGLGGEGGPEMPEMPKAAGQLNPSLGGKMADFGKGLAGLGKGAGQAVAGFMRGLASGIAAFANPAVVAGAAVLIGTVAVGIIAIGGALSLAALMLGKTLPVLAKGLTSFNEIDGGNLAKVGLGLLAASLGLAGFGAAMITIGLASPIILAGTAALAMSSAVLLGMAKVASMVLPDFVKALVGFNEVDGGNLAKVGLSLLPLSLGIFALGPALASLGIGTVVDKIANMFSDDKGGLAGVVEKIKEFEKFKLDATVIKANAESIVAFANGLNALRSLGGGWFSDDISVVLKKVAEADFAPVLASMKDFAEGDIGNPSTLKAKGEAFLAFGQAIESISNIATGGWLSADLGKKLAKWPSKESFKPLYDSYMDFSKQEVGKSAELKNKAEAFKAYGEAIKAVSDIASGGWFEDDLSEKIATWAATDVTPLYTKLQEFSNLPVGDVKAIEGKAKGLTAFSQAMSSIEEVPEINPTAMSNITTGFANFITATANAVPAKITATATGLNALSEAFGKYANGPIAQAEKITKNFNTALDTLGNALTKVGTALASIQTSKIDKIKDAFSPQFTAAFTASLMALANIYEGKKVDAGAITRTGRDVVSNSGYGERTLVTPSGPIALHNSDTVVAYANDMIANDGVRLLSKGALLNNQPAQSTPVNVSVDMGRLEQKLDAVVRAIGSMNVEMDGAKVGKVLVNASEAGGQVGVFGLQSRATL